VSVFVVTCKHMEEVVMVMVGVVICKRKVVEEMVMEEVVTCKHMEAVVMVMVGVETCKCKEVVEMVMEEEEEGISMAEEVTCTNMVRRHVPHHVRHVHHALAAMVVSSVCVRVRCMEEVVRHKCKAHWPPQ
jgi:hypothetical protein